MSVYTLSVRQTLWVCESFWPIH